MPQNSTRVLARANNLAAAGKLAKATALCESVIRRDPSNYDGMKLLGIIQIQGEHYDHAAATYERLERSCPQDWHVLNQLSWVYMTQGLVGKAQRKQEQALAVAPDKIENYFSLCAIAQARGDHAGFLFNALRAARLQPTSPEVFSVLGSALNTNGRFADSRKAFETAIALDPGHTSALLNLGVVEAQELDFGKAIGLFQRALVAHRSRPSVPIEMIQYSLAFAYLNTGRLGEGWDLHEVGFYPRLPKHSSRSPARTFDVPKWDGSPLDGRRLLVWREQGVGDEVMFMSCLSELEAAGGEIIVECEPRLVAPVTRAFPGFRVRATAYSGPPEMRSPFHDFDLHLPLGSLMRLYRRSLDDFARSSPFLRAWPEAVEKFRTRLGEKASGVRRIGVCWRSDRLAPTRNLGYSDIAEWAELFRLPNCEFVNLQYGQCEAEIQGAESQFGVSLRRWSDVDLKNDLDDVLALISCLDHVVTVGTAVSPFAGAVGTPVSLLLSHWDWSNLGTTRLPWFPKTTCYVDPGQPVATSIPHVVADLA